MVFDDELSNFVMKIDDFENMLNNFVMKIDKFLKISVLLS